MEVWRDVVGYEGVYQVSNFGRVKRIKPAKGAISGKVLKQGSSKRGVRNVVLSKESKPRSKDVHRLVAIAFLGEPPTERHVVAHNDGNPSNNRLANLRWATYGENVFDMVLHGTAKGKNRGRKSSVTDEQVSAIRADRRPIVEIAKDYKLSRSSISNIKMRKSHKHIPPSPNDYTAGERRVKFADEEIIKIRQDPRKSSVIANEFGCSAGAIRDIKAKRSYANVGTVKPPVKSQDSEKTNKPYAAQTRIYGDVCYFMLPSGVEVLFDSDLSEKFSVLRWREQKNQRTSYAVFREKLDDGTVKSVLMHRFILDAPDDMLVDHINGNGLDNRRCNLRLVNRSQNAMNSRAHRDSSTGIKGAYYEKRTGSYYSRITVNGKNIHLGTFQTAEEAAEAYAEASRKYHGEYGRTHLDD